MVVETLQQHLWLMGETSFNPPLAGMVVETLGQEGNVPALESFNPPLAGMVVETGRLVVNVNDELTFQPTPSWDGR